jgi:hypothetical protein
VPTELDQDITLALSGDGDRKQVDQSVQTEWTELETEKLELKVGKSELATGKSESKLETGKLQDKSPGKSQKKSSGKSDSKLETKKSPAKSARLPGKSKFETEDGHSQNV